MVKKKTDTVEDIAGLSKSAQLKNILNSTLPNSKPASMASDEVYKSGFWPTGILPLDVVLGGGLAKGRFSLAYGESATLKSLIGLATIAQVQKQGGTAALFDLEHAFNQEWAEELGINTDELILDQPETGEDAVDKLEVLLRNDVDFVCVDSIAALLPRSERELMLSGKDNVQPARIAALMAIGLRKLTGANSKSSVFWISQMRDTIGAMAFSPKTNVTGGKSIHYYISQSLQLKKTGKVYESVSYFDGEKDQTGKQVVAQNFLAEQVKSRFGQPFTQSYFNFDLVKGQVDIPNYLIQQGLQLGVITKAGAWWTYLQTDADGVVLNEFKAGSKDKFKELVVGDAQVQRALLEMVCNKYELDVQNYVREPQQ